jgi:hypothetical protein
MMSGALLLTIGASAYDPWSQLTVSPGQVSFASQATGTTSAAMAFTLTNNSKNQVSVTRVQSSVVQFSYSGPALPVTLAAGKSLTASVTFSPSAAVRYSGWMTFTVNTGMPTYMELSGTGVTKAPAPVAPAITSNPASQTVIAGQTATFSVVATGTAPLSYQWTMNGTAINGASSTSYTTAATTIANSGETFSVTVSNAAGSATSGSATLTVNAPVVAPAITSNPANQTVTAGQTATFSGAATGTAPLTYQWKLNGAAISGATATSYTTSATTTANSGEIFSVTVSNTAGSATSGSASLTVNAPVVAPSITSNPTNQTVTAGQMATFSVVATGTAPLTYQWNMNGAAIGGATATSYTTAATTTANSGEAFSVTASNAAGSATSGSATLTVNALVVAPAFTSNPTSQTVTAGQTATFFAVATGTAPITYQWNMNGAAIGGATSAAYTTAATTTANSGETFSVTVSNSAGTITSSSATLTVNPAATMLLGANPSSLSFGSVTVGSNSVLPVTLTNSGNSNVTVSNVSISGAGFTPSGVSTGQILTPGTATMNVTFAPAASGNATGSVTITSNATNSPMTISLAGAGAAPATFSVALTWSPSTSSVVGYNVYRATTAGGEAGSSPINGSTLISGENFTDTNLVDGTTYYYVVTAVNSTDVQSADSMEVSAIIP